MFFHYLAIDAAGNKIGRANLTDKQVKVQESNLIVSGYLVVVNATDKPIDNTEEALIAAVKHPMF